MATSIQHPLYYPSYGDGLDSVDFRTPNKIIYTFRSPKSSEDFGERILQWGKENRLPPLQLEYGFEQPFLKETPFFPANPEVRSYKAIISLPRHEHLPHIFYQAVNQLGTAQTELSYESTTLPTLARATSDPARTKLREVRFDFPVNR